MITEICSLQHPLVKKWVRLRTEKEARQEEQSVLLVGKNMIRDLAGQVRLKALISVEEGPDIRADLHYRVTEDILRKITGVASPDGWAAVAELPQPRSLAGLKRILLLDRVADPGNLGTLLRSALALGWDGVFFTPETVDPFNDKALRASKGALFSLPFAYGDGASFVREEKRQIYLADLEGTSLKGTSPKSPFVLILSHEGTGPSAWAEKCAQKISIPMHNSVESLNVSACGAIFLYVMGPHD